MNRSVVRIVKVSLVAFCLFTIHGAEHGAYSQTPNASPSPEPASPTVLLKQGATVRERRAQAYAKLLEGQRILSLLRREGGTSTLRLARQAFQDAATLDPTLAEAHTALAELSFYYPPQDFDAAAREGANAARVNPDNFGAHQLLARLFTLKSGLREGTLNRSAVDFAIRELKHVARLDKKNAEAWALLGELYQATGKTAEALDAWSRWAAAPPSTDTRFFQYVTSRELSQDAASARLSEGLLAAGRGTEALAAVRRAMALEPENREYADLLAQILESSGLDDKTAIGELQRMTAANPSNIGTIQLLARIQARSGRIDDAAITVRAAMARQPKDDREQQLLRTFLAQLYADGSRYSEAIAVYEEQLTALGVGTTQLATEDAKLSASRILLRIIDVQKRAGRNQDVLATIERMRRLFGTNDATADMQHINFLREQQKNDEALRAARAARQRFPEQPDFLLLEAETLTDLGRVDEGVGLLRTTLKGSVQDIEAYLAISSLYLRAARASDAVTAARKALELAPAARPDIVEAALITLSSAQERAGDQKGSEESLRRILAGDPANATALNNLGYFLIERNERLTEGLEMIRRAVRSNPTNASFLDSLGWALFKLGKLDEAERHLADAARRNSLSATIQEHLGDLYDKQGKTELARASWQKALSLTFAAPDSERLKSKLARKPSK